MHTKEWLAFFYMVTNFYLQDNPYRQVNRIAFFGPTCPQTNGSFTDLASIHAALVAGLESGTLRPVVGQELPLQDAARAHQAVMEAGAYGKIVLVP